jgi:hemerythrin-like domain-containing protein
MEMMRRRKPTEELEHEHHVIQKVVGAMAVLVVKLESGKVIDCAVLTALSEFMYTFGDKCHHGKEENYCSNCWQRRACR